MCISRSHASMRSAAFAHPCASDYSHRKAWVLERLTQLSSMLAIDICGPKGAKGQIETDLGLAIHSPKI
jgi:hypothetical protein